MRQPAWTTEIDEERWEKCGSVYGTERVQIGNVTWKTSGRYCGKPDLNAFFS